MLTVLLALTLALAPAVPQEVRPPDYAGTWAWCGERFPYRPDLQEACRWGAYEMVPTTEWRA